MAQPGTLTRTIHFYRMHNGVTASGTPARVDLRPALQHVEGLPWTATGRYLVDNEGNAVCSWLGDKPSELRLAIVRRSALPRVERGGRLSALRIESDAGIAEQTHVVFFEDNVVGVEFNFYGPRLGRLGSYLADKAPLHTPANLSFEALLRKDLSAQLARLEDVRCFNLRVRPSYADTLSKVSRDLGSALDAIASAGLAEDVELVLRAPRNKTLPQKLLAWAKTLYKRADLAENAHTFSVKGLDQETGRVTEVDLLRDALVSKRPVIRLDARARAVESASAFQAIRDSYKELKSEIRAAAAISL